MARSFQNDLPHALRENAWLAARQGAGRRARRFLDKSLAVALRQEARYEYAQTLLARGQVGLELGWTEGAEEVARARLLLGLMEAP